MNKIKFNEVSEFLLDKGLLLSPDILEEEVDQQIVDNLLEKTDDAMLILNKDLYDLFLEQKNIAKANWDDFEKASFSKEKKQGRKVYDSFLTFLKDQAEKEEQAKSPVKIVFSYKENPKKRTYQDFVSMFNARFKEIHTMLGARQELQGLTSIARLIHKKDRESVSVVGMIKAKVITKNKNIIITLEDPTGEIQVVISKDKKEPYDIAKECVEDEVIGIVGTSGNKVIFATNVLLPDIPLSKELKKAPKEEYLVMLGDPHFGSKHFLTEAFERFLTWINGKAGSDEQKEMAKKIKYLVLTGDLVEGVGIYPGQEEDLAIKDIKEQYDKFAEYLKCIPKHIHLIISPGNHDAGRIAEPQPPLYKDFAEAIWQLPNAIFVSNPATVNIASTEDFPGFDILIYHGYSLIYYANHVETIRAAGGQKRPDLIMKYLLQRRHLAPTHTSTQYVPLAKMDPLVISKIPDFFITGHIHRISVGNYRNVTLLNCSSWTGITEDQEKRGLEPQPARVPIVNLKTREVKVMNFIRS
ncbi:MAG: metallophosphoesterase [archaeon]